ncbi:MAG TPA: DUF3572 domain-containing protein [Croceibacterium sp.]|nr:DUF3572 domain-containing protein [Croceibacterium sp.]
MSITTRLGIKLRARSIATLPSATGSTAKPPACNTSQNSFRLRSLSSTTRILFVIATPVSSAPTEAFRDHYLLNGWLTILNRSEDSVKDPAIVALRALAWVLSDTALAERFVALTGLAPETLRSIAGEQATHRAVLDHLCAHEPDLVAAAAALGLSPADLAAARAGIAP